MADICPCTMSYFLLQIKHDIEAVPESLHSLRYIVMEAPTAWVSNNPVNSNLESLEVVIQAYNLQS